MDIIKKITETPKETLKKITKPLNFLKLTSISPKKSIKKIGKPPGTLIYVGKDRTEKVKLQVIDYTKSKLNEFEAKKTDEVFKFRDKKSVTWINVTGIHDTEVIKKIGEHFKLHPLLLEDVVNTNQRPKLEEFDNGIFLVLKMLYYDEKTNQIKIEQVSLVIGKGFVISFQESEGDVFEPIRKRIRERGGRIRNCWSDYLAHSLIDAIVDNYFVVLEKIGDKIEEMEENMSKDISPNILSSIYSMKRELIILRKSIWPLREVINGLQKEESKFIRKETLTYFRSIYDHTIQVIDTLETFRDMLSGMQDLYISISGNKMNEIMKVLTIIATIFIPLTFIAGIYGMNFDYMPELTYRWAYFIVWGIMILVAFIMMIYFKRKKWI